jgi:hypothetical protein
VTDESTRYGVIQSTPTQGGKREREKKNMRGLGDRLAEKNTVLEFLNNQ